MFRGWRYPQRWTRAAVLIKRLAYHGRRSIRMIDLKDLRENPDKYRKGAQLKNVAVDVDAILRLDDSRVRAQQEFEQLRAEQNKASKEIGKLKDPEEKKAANARMGDVARKVKDSEEKSKATEAELQTLLLQVPQPPDDD